MTPIKDIPGLPSEFRKIKRDKEPKRISDPSKSGDLKQSQTKKAGTEKSDQVKISSTGRDLLKRTEDVQKYIQELKNQDYHEVSRIQSAISEGKYGRPEVIDKIADGILAHPEFQNILQERKAELHQDRQDEKKLTDDEIRLIRRKIKDGDYDRPEVVDRIADELLKKP